MVNCKLDLNAIMADNGAGGSPALLFVNLFYHQRFVTGVTKTSKTGLPLSLSARSYWGVSKSETDPGRTSFPELSPDLRHWPVCTVVQMLLLPEYISS